MCEVVVQQSECDGLQCPRHGRDLGEDVDAVLLVLDHPLQAAGLAFDPLQPAQVGLFVADVTVRCLLGHAHHFLP
jgi:hypothetical protein